MNANRPDIETMLKDYPALVVARNILRIMEEETEPERLETIADTIRLTKAESRPLRDVLTDVLIYITEHVGLYDDEYTDQIVNKIENALSGR